RGTSSTSRCRASRPPRGRKRRAAGARTREDGTPRNGRRSGMSDRTGALATAACLLCLATGCGTERSLSDRDEAAAGQWSLSDEPLLRIGVVSGDEPYQMHDVRDAVRLPDGRIVVAHQGARQVRVYAPDGRFLIASGGDGDG